MVDLSKPESLPLAWKNDIGEQRVVYDSKNYHRILLTIVFPKREIPAVIAKNETLFFAMERGSYRLLNGRVVSHEAGDVSVFGAMSLMEAGVLESEKSDWGLRVQVPRYADALASGKDVEVLRRQGKPLPQGYNAYSLMKDGLGKDAAKPFSIRRLVAGNKVSAGLLTVRKAVKWLGPVKKELLWIVLDNGATINLNGRLFRARRDHLIRVPAGFNGIVSISPSGGVFSALQIEISR